MVNLVICDRINPLEDIEFISSMVSSKNIRLIDVLNIFTPEDVILFFEKVPDNVQITLVKPFSVKSLLAEALKISKDEFVVIYGLPCNSLDRALGYPCSFILFWFMDRIVENSVDSMFFLLSDDTVVLSVFHSLFNKVFLKVMSPTGPTFKELK